jgi:hypothetical protein
MTLELFDKDKHYDIICSWWSKHDWPIVPINALPKTGLIVSDDGMYTCSGFLYATDSSLCWLEWIVSNPDVEYNKRDMSMYLLINGLVEISKKNKFSHIFTSASHSGLIERYKNCGFKQTDLSMTNLIKEIQ